MRIVIFSIVLLMMVSMACVAAENAKVTLSAQSTPIEQVMADLGKQAGVQIICDSDVKTTVSGSFDSIELDKLMDTIAKINNLKWQKIYLPVQQEEKPTLEQVKARAAAVAAVEGNTIVVFDPATGKQKVFIEQDPAAPSIAPDKLGLAPVYLVSMPKAEKSAAASQTSQANSADVEYFKQLQDERLKLMANMTSEERITAIRQEMDWMLNLDPATRKQIIRDQINARRNLDPATRQKYQQIMRETFGGQMGGQRQGRNGGNRPNSNQNNTAPRQ